MWGKHKVDLSLGVLIHWWPTWTFCTRKHAFFSTVANILWFQASRRFFLKKLTLWFLLMGDNCILLAITNCVQLETRHCRRADSSIRQQTEGNTNLRYFAPFSLCVHRSMNAFWNLLMAIKLQSPFYVTGIVTPGIWSAMCT